jgi:serine/threonine protein kinase
MYAKYSTSELYSLYRSTVNGTDYQPPLADQRRRRSSPVRNEEVRSLRGHSEATRSWRLQEEIINESKTNLVGTKKRLCEDPKDIAQRCGWNDDSGVKRDLSSTHRGILGNGKYGVVEEVKLQNQGSHELNTMVRKRFDIRAERRRILLVQNEIKVLKRLSHPHIVRLIGTYEENQDKYSHKMYILMSPVGDNDLRAFLHNAAPYICKGINPEFSKYCLYLKTWFRCLASALFYLHKHLIQHEDIKPNNIIYKEADIFFTDFGSSRELLLDEATSTESPALATRLFAAPEAMPDHNSTFTRHGFQTDVFSLGLVFVEMLWILSGGEVPLRQHLEEQTKATILQYHHVLPEIDSLLSKGECVQMYSQCVKPMLAITRQDRPSAEAVLQDISKAKCWRTLACPCQDEGDMPEH